MHIEAQFSLRPLPPITTSPPIADAVGAVSASPLGVLQNLPGTWTGTGFNVIWRPFNQADPQDPPQTHFLELNLTKETLEFSNSIGDIPNRGFLQPDIVMQGMTYLQKISDANLNVGLHIEPGFWAVVPLTTNPQEPATVVRMASIPHGTTIVAQGLSTVLNTAPMIPNNNILPFTIGNPDNTRQFSESDLNTTTAFRSGPAQLAGINQQMIDNPNSVLQHALQGQTILNTIQLDISTMPTPPLVGGGTSNTAFLTGAQKPNAVAAVACSTFWIEHVQGQSGGPDFLQLQYSQRVLLNFNGLSWPHVSVATLQKVLAT